jgi:hypothetical protein
MQPLHPTGDATPPRTFRSYLSWLARAIHRRVRFNKNHGADLLDPVILPFGPDGTVNEFMRTLLSSTEIIFTRASLWTEPSIASAYLNCSTEGATEGLSRPGDLLDRCYGRDELQLHRAERET